MKFLTGDETGILKWVRVEAQKVERFGPQLRGDAVERLCWAGPAADRESRLGVGHASGCVQLRDGVSGQVLGSANIGPNVRCLNPLGSGVGAGGLLAISASGAGSIVKGWRDAEISPDGEADAHKFELPGPINFAQADPLLSNRIVFGGGENDVKIFDLAKNAITWRAKNVREDTLSLRVPVKVNCLQWATELAPSRSLILCGTTDGKIRLYDANTQRRPICELLVGFGAGAGTGGYTGTVDELARPLTCGTVASMRGDGWSFLVGNTVGVLREYDLRKLGEIQSCPHPPGRKAHKVWANRQIPFRRGYKGIMGSIRAVDVHATGEAVVAVGIGRFAYLFETRKKRMLSKIYLKQKLCSTLFSAEEDKNSKKEAAQEEEEEEEKPGRAPIEGGSGDELAEGFTSDEGEDGEEGGEDGEEEEGGEEEDDEGNEGSDVDVDEDDDEEEDEESEEEGSKNRGAAASKATKQKPERQQTTVIMPDDAGASKKAAAFVKAEGGPDAKRQKRPAKGSAPPAGGSAGKRRKGGS